MSEHALSRSTLPSDATPAELVRVDVAAGVLTRCARAGPTGEAARHGNIAVHDAVFDLEFGRRTDHLTHDHRSQPLERT